MDPRILTIWDAVGHEKAAVLTSVKDWTDKRRFSASGLIVDQDSKLKIFRASPEEGFGDNNKYISISRVRPVDTVNKKYFDGAGGTSTSTGPRKRIKSAKAAQQEGTGNDMIDDSVPMVEGANALSTRSVTLPYSIAL